MDGGTGDRPIDPFAPPAATPAYPPPVTPVYGAPPLYGAPPVYGAPSPPGWYPDPYGGLLRRHWDGAAWGALEPPPPPPRAGRGVAVAALVLSLIGLVVPAVVCAIVAINRGRRTGRGDDWVPFAALGLSAAWIAGGIWFAAAHGSLDTSASLPAPTSSATQAPAGTVLSSELTAGQCLEVPYPLPAYPVSFELRVCGQPHNGEVIKTGELVEGVYPGETQVKATVRSTCRAALESYVGTSNSTLHYVALFPTTIMWTAGNRRYTCVAVDRAGDVSTTMKNSKA